MDDVVPAKPRNIRRNTDDEGSTPKASRNSTIEHGQHSQSVKNVARLPRNNSQESHGNILKGKSMPDNSSSGKNIAIEMIQNRKPKPVANLLPQVSNRSRKSLEEDTETIGVRSKAGNRLSQSPSVAVLADS